MRNQRFTLIELLVVVAIISILASLLLPALLGAKKKAQAVACMNNLKSVSMGYVFYADTYDDYMPNSRFFPDGWQTKIGQTGVWGAMSHNTERVWQDWTTIPNSARLSYAVLECPSEPNVFSGTGGVAAGKTFNRFTHGYYRSSYMQNYTMMKSYTEPRRGWSGGPLKMNGDTSSADINGDAEKDSGAFSAYLDGVNKLTASGTHAFHHPGLRANIAYWDGHVGSVRMGETYFHWLF